MSHAHHFLSRLDRLALPHVELSLSLYRDHELLKFVLQKARVPEATPRIAISLDHPENGPFLVVTRDGKFVTCLGEGMSYGALPVLSRARLDAIAADYQTLRERMAESRQRIGRHGSLGKLLARLYHAGHRLSREDFRAIAVWQPMLDRQFLLWHVDAAMDCAATVKIFMRDLRRTNKLDHAFDEALTAFYHTQWALAHVTVLACLGGKTSFEALTEEALSTFSRFTISFPCVRQHLYAIGIRGIWAAARVGKPFLPHYKAGLASAQNLARHGNAAAGLAAIGLRHSRLGAEVQKALRTEPSDISEKRLAIRRAVLQVIEDHERDPEGTLHALASRGAEEAMRLSPLAPEGSPYRFKRAEDVPRDLALCIYANRLLDFLRHPLGIHLAFDILPWLSQIDAEALYLPADYLSAVRVPWTPAQSTVLLVMERDILAKSIPLAHVKEGPLRNAPCPCGSGKKYKRCCSEKENQPA